VLSSTVFTIDKSDCKIVKVTVPVSLFPCASSTLYVITVGVPKKPPVGVKITSPEAFTVQIPSPATVKVLFPLDNTPPDPVVVNSTVLATTVSPVVSLVATLNAVLADPGEYVKLSLLAIGKISKVNSDSEEVISVHTFVELVIKTRYRLPE